jgi:hypothetical protein
MHSSSSHAHPPEPAVSECLFVRSHKGEGGGEAHQGWLVQVFQVSEVLDHVLCGGTDPTEA